VLRWLCDELAAGGAVEHTALDQMLFAGCREGRSAFQTESDQHVIPGIFSDDGIGETRYSESRCCREGRVLHYVILASDLKASVAWRPDPLAPHLAHLLVSPSSADSVPGDKWRPCLLRLTSRSVRYSLRKGDGKNYGGAFPEWQEPLLGSHGDILEYSVSFLFLDRVEVDRDGSLVTLHARDRALHGDAIAIPEYAPRAMPLVFRVNREDAEVWRAVVKRCWMSCRAEFIINYVGPVREHPHLPDVFYRHGPEGEQLWDDGCRYAGSWEAHTYHGHGQLSDATGALIYRGQWHQGMKHGEGVYFFSQGNILRSYSGQWVREEFSGQGDLRVLDASVEELKRKQPCAVVRYRGCFGNTNGRFNPCLSALRLEPTKHSTQIHEHFPTRALSSDELQKQQHQQHQQQRPERRPLVQRAGCAPRDLAGSVYGLDGADLARCGPDTDCRIWYIDGTSYVGPCLAGAVPHGPRGLLVESNGTRYEGGFDRGQRVGVGLVTLENGVAYEGHFAYPQGHRDGQGRIVVPENLHEEVGLASYTGQYFGGTRQGVGKAVFSDGAEYVGSFRGNRRHGRGTMRESSGVVVTGDWESDMLSSGDMEIRYTSGHLYSGRADAGIRRGQGILLEPGNLGHWEILYDGEWQDDCFHGEGTFYGADGCYRGQFVAGSREGTGRFDYLVPKAGASTPSTREASQRYYEGEWRGDVQHGRGTYVDEYGYELTNAVCDHGHLVSNRRPPKRGIKGRLLDKSTWPTKFEPFFVEPTDRKPTPKLSGHALLRPRPRLPEADPDSIAALDHGSGRCHGRGQPAHFGPDGGPKGERWA